MSATRRGYAVCGICLLALALGATFGARALNAVVVPGLVALAAGWIGVRRTARPTVTRSRPAPGFPGDVREITLDVDSDDATSATVRDTVGEGLSTTAGAIETGIPGAVTYECAFERRGEHAIGPAVVIVTDALGLFEREFRSTRRTDVLVYPPVERLSGYAREALLGGREASPLDDRGEFDSLREYVPGDPLRDVHWKSSAKRDSFVVTEFAADTEAERLAIAAEAAPGRGHRRGQKRRADEMASAVASVACWLLDRGVEIDLVTPDGRLSGAHATRERVLRTLARTGAGRVATSERESADVAIAAEIGVTTVTVGGETHPFERFVDPGGFGGDHERRRTAGGGATEQTTTGNPGATTADGGINPESTFEEGP